LRKSNQVERDLFTLLDFKQIKNEKKERKGLSLFI